MTSIDPSLYLRNSQTTRSGSSQLGKDEFLKILMAQLQNQDPLNPMEDKEFISQMANFSSLEQMMNLSSSFEKFVANQNISPVIQYSHLIGKQVEYYRFNEDTGELVQPLEKEIAKVSAVSENKGYAVMELDNGKKIYTDEILKISED
ncbi:flagellar basal-body rod modification protein FlgD [Gracilibacillus halotolerans]|uniref:Flagellar basal-body rod modification protein FlgD n=1 Tax=Gracilibacillus halotolerans TaxID=74386 RepID=A0A841RIG0_9BACI|nr:flagellar basal-body rod modification protein FlgD [Gracilibacillus halotolerans]